MKEKEMVILNDVPYEYCGFYKRLERINMAGSRSHPAIACPECHGFMFTIVYGDYECIGDCPCGHSLTLYGG